MKQIGLGLAILALLVIAAQRLPVGAVAALPPRAAIQDEGPATAPTAPPPASPGFVPSQYLGQGNAYNCSSFVSQADAQAVLRADPSDPNRLDAARHGATYQQV